MKIFRYMLPAVFVLGLAACVGALTLSKADSDAVTKTLTALANKNIDQLKAVEAEASVLINGAMADQHGYNCAAAALLVQADMQKLIDSQKGQTIGALSAAEFATIIAPGSAVFEYEWTNLETGCIAKVHDVNKQMVAVPAVAGSIAAFLGLPVGA